MARVYCHECGKDFFVAFSCKTRLFCPTCSQKRTLLWADWVNGNILKNVPHRQWVFTIPRILRKLFYRDRKLPGKLADCVKDTIEEIFNVIFQDKSYQVGVIISIQTFGDLLIWHPHIHCLVTDGVFDAIGNFHSIPKIDADKAMIIFREKVFKMLKDNNRISDTLIFKMRHWNHSGFSVNNEVYINQDNPEALERLAQYIVHSSFSTDKIKYIEETGSVMYKSKMHLE